MNDKHIEKGLDHKNLQVTTIKYLADHRKHRYRLVDEPKKQSNRIFISKQSATKVIMDCRITAAHKFNTRLGSKKYDIILTKNQSALTKIKS